MTNAVVKTADAAVQEPKKRARKPWNKRLGWTDVVLFIVLTLLALTILIPFYTSVVISFMSEQEYVRNPFSFFPKNPTLESYEALMIGGAIGNGYRNTLINVAFGLPLSMFLTCSLGYVLSRKGYPGRKLLFVFILITMLFSGGVVPGFLNIKELGLMNSRWSVILSGGLSTYNTILMMSYINSLPKSLFESAKLDGAKEFQVLFRIVLPLCKPILATLCLFYLVDKWNEWFLSMLYMSKNSMYPLQLQLRQIVNNSQLQIMNGAVSDSELTTRQTFSMGVKMAAVVVTMLPVMCVFPFLQKYFVAGITLGAVKE